MNERRFRRGLITLVIAVVILTSVVYILPEPVRATAPTISYITPSNGATFVDVVPGDGVNYTVDITDSDGDLQQVVLQDNATGSWVTFYDSGTLGGVSEHNHSGINPHWTGSWETYYWKICARDGTGWTNVTYSFTTEYVFGQPHCVVLDDSVTLKTSVLYKNTTGDYYLWYVNDTNDDIDAKTSSVGTDFPIRPKTKAFNSDGVTLYVWNAFTYNNIPYLYFQIDSYIRYLWYNITAGAWQSSSNLIYLDYGCGADVKYYDGQYQKFFMGDDLYQYVSNSPLDAGTKIFTFYDRYPYTSPSVEILDGKLILIYTDNSAGYKLHWRVYDGVSWTNKGTIETIGSAPLSSLRDLINNHLVLVYKNSSGWLVYRTLTDPDSTWSDPVVIYKPVSGETINYLHADYIDRRIVITFASNLRGNYNIYMITAPDYTAVTSGISTTFNRIQFPDAVPNQQHVNSTVFAIKNINDRPILNITWHVGNIGDIQTANNVRVWSNMSGSWQSWLVGADQNTSEIDISAVKGSEWMPGETLYWKIEILNTGNVPEDLHASDDNIWYIVDLGT